MWISRWNEKRDERGFQLEIDWRHGRKVRDLRLMVKVGGGENGRDLTFSVAIPHRNFCSKECLADYYYAECVRMEQGVRGKLLASEYA